MKTRKFLRRALSVALAMMMLMSVVAVIGASAKTKAKSNYPYVLCPGFNCYGPDSGLAATPYGHYYGGMAIGNLADELKDKGYTALEVQISPLSSNWDRACELYACIMGGRVDYGAAHSKKYGHKRYGRTYPGLYKKWDNKHPVNLIGHSMGASTVRLLAYLLYYGDKSEQAATGSKTSGLFTGKGKNMINSVTTLAGVNNGTTACDLARGLINDIAGTDEDVKFASSEDSGYKFWSTAFYAFGVITSQGKIADFFDAQLEQWDFEMKEDEDAISFIKRLTKSKAFTTKDMAYFDMFPSTMAKFNKKYKDNPNCYYFAFPTKISKKDGDGPEQTMGDNAALFGVTAYILGHYKDTNVPGGWKNSYYASDGVVNTAFTKAPFLGRSTKGTTWKKGTKAKRGQWYNMPTLPYEHNAVIGAFIPGTLDWDMVGFYADHLAYVNSLA